MGSDWLTNDLWRAHVSWLTPGWVDSSPVGRSDFDAARWLDQIQSAHYQTFIFYSKFHDGHCTYPSRYSSFSTERDYLGECAAEARRRGMRLITYFSSILDQFIGSQHPDWQVRGRDGLPAKSWATQRWPDAYCCINNPGYRAYMLGQIQEICENYHPDCMWLDVYEPLTTDICFCPDCQEKYRQQTHGKNLYDLHDLSWYQACYVDFLKEIKSLVTTIDPACVIGQNTGARHPEYDPIDDFYTREAFTAPAISLYCRSMRPLGKPFETTSRLYSSVQSWAMRAPDRVLLESLASVVHGGASCMELSPTPNGKIMEEAVQRLAEAGGYIRALEPFLLNTSPVYDAAVLQPEHLCGGPWGTTNPPGGWTSALMERDIPHACVYPDGDLTPYPLVILDDSLTVDGALASKLTRYVAQGGSLIVEGNPTNLAELLGVDVIGKTGGAAHYLSALDSRLSMDLGADELIVEGEAWRVTPTSALPLAFLRREMTDRALVKDIWLNLPPHPQASSDPAITVNSFGNGHALFIACPLTCAEIRTHRNNPGEAREYPTQLAANLARFLLPEPVLRGTTPAGVEVVVNRQAGKTIVHLLNQYVTGQYYDNRRNAVRLAGVTVSINQNRTGPIRRVFQAEAGSLVEVRFARDGKWVEVTLAELGVHAALVFEAMT